MGRRKRAVECLGAYKRPVEKSWGFTLLELFVVMVFLGILATLAIPTYMQRIEKSRIIKAVGQIKEISRAVRAYKAKTDVLPANLNHIGYHKLLDPWGNPYQYVDLENRPPGQGRKKEGQFINNDFDLYSKGEDGKSQRWLYHPDSKDDIIRADSGIFIGPVSRY